MPPLLNARLITLTATLLAALSAHAARNRLSPVPVRDSDAKSPGIKTEPCSEGAEDFGSIKDGDFIVFKGYDFDSGVAAFQARVSTPRKCTIDFHLHSPAGPLLGTVAVPVTGGWQNWEDVARNVDNSQSGVRDVYLIFHGPPPVALVNLQSIVFLKSVVTWNVRPLSAPRILSK